MPHANLFTASRAFVWATRAVLILAVLPLACTRNEAVAAPLRLADTGLYADFSARRVAADVLPFSPQYPLWTDGAAKQRWIALPPGTSIDASDVDHWRFPIGTRVWKQFDFGRPVETRYMELSPDGTWLYATYRWSDDGSDALLAPATGARAVIATEDGQHHDLPSVADCRLCHEGTTTPVLGFSALQLSPDRDALAPHAAAPRQGDVDLDALVARGLLVGLPTQGLASPPRISARTPRERAALGYLHGNCSNCHNANGPLERLGLRFDYPLDAITAPALTTALGVESRFKQPGVTSRLSAGAPEQSALLHRLRATDPLRQMPPFGRHLADRDAVELIEAWIRDDLAATTVTVTNPNPVPRKR